MSRDLHPSERLALVQGNGQDAPEVEEGSIVLIDPVLWHGKPIPIRQWAWDQWIPAGAVTGLGGPPGAAKSTFGQQLCTHYVLRWPLLDARVAHGRALFVTCEDDPDDLHRRQAQINAAMGIEMEDLGGLLLESRQGKDSRLITHIEASFHRTSYFQELDELIGEQNIGLLTLDLAPDFWDGNENNRQQVNAFIKAHLAHFCQAHGTAVLLLYHPSIRGIREGDGQSGSTAWEGSVRARLYLDRERDADGKVVPDSTIRTLARPKANYADLAETDLVWREGYLWQTQETAGRKSRDEKIDEAFLWCLEQCARKGQDVSPAYQSRAFYGKVFPELIAGDRRRKRITSKQFEKSYRRLFWADRVETYFETRSNNKTELIRQKAGSVTH